MKQAITIHENDDVAVALTDLPKGSTVELNSRKITLGQTITLA